MRRIYLIDNTSLSGFVTVAHVTPLLIHFYDLQNIESIQSHKMVIYLLMIKIKIKAEAAMLVSYLGLSVISKITLQNGCYKVCTFLMENSYQA